MAAGFSASVSAYAEKFYTLAELEILNELFTIEASWSKSGMLGTSKEKIAALEDLAYRVTTKYREIASSQSTNAAAGAGRLSEEDEDLAKKVDGSAPSVVPSAPLAFDAPEIFAAARAILADKAYASFHPLHQLRVFLLTVTDTPTRNNINKGLLALVQSFSTSERELKEILELLKKAKPDNFFSALLVTKDSRFLKEYLTGLKNGSESDRGQIAQELGQVYSDGTTSLERVFERSYLDRWDILIEFGAKLKGLKIKGKSVLCADQEFSKSLGLDYSESEDGHQVFYEYFGTQNLNNWLKRLEEYANSFKSESSIPNFKFSGPLFNAFHPRLKDIVEQLSMWAVEHNQTDFLIELIDAFYAKDCSAITYRGRNNKAATFEGQNILAYLEIKNMLSDLKLFNKLLSLNPTNFWQHEMGHVLLMRIQKKELQGAKELIEAKVRVKGLKSGLAHCIIDLPEADMFPFLELLRNPQININELNHGLTEEATDLTPLHYAVLRNKPLAIAYLLHIGANKEIKFNEMTAENSVQRLGLSELQPLFSMNQVQLEGYIRQRLQVLNPTATPVDELFDDPTPTSIHLADGTFAEIHVPTAPPTQPSPTADLPPSVSRSSALNPTFTLDAMGAWIEGLAEKVEDLKARDVHCDTTQQRHKALQAVFSSESARSARASEPLSNTRDFLSPDTDAELEEARRAYAVLVRVLPGLTNAVSNAELAAGRREAETRAMASDLRSIAAILFKPEGVSVGTEGVAEAKP